MANWLARAKAIASRRVPANDEAARRWHVRYPGVDPMEVIFAPQATHAEVVALYPGAQLEPLPDVVPEPVTLGSKVAENDFQAPEPGPLVADDRRTCTECANLTAAGRCLAAARGELSYVVSRKYSPVPDGLKRCEGFRDRGARGRGCE